MHLSIHGRTKTIMKVPPYLQACSVWMHKLNNIISVPSIFMDGTMGIAASKLNKFIFLSNSNCKTVYKIITFPALSRVGDVFI